MAWDLSIALIQATVQVDQPQGEDHRTVATAFLVDDPTPDGRPRTVLVTAGHVFGEMPGPQARIGWRTQGADGVWRFDPKPLAIRDGATELWVRSPSRDIAAIEVTAPPEFARAAIPLSWLAGSDLFERYGIGPGDEVMALGYPRGLSSNGAGFPILREGRIASYPLSPAAQFPNFLVDFNAMPGNSGGPVFLEKAPPVQPGAPPQPPASIVAGMLIQEVEQTTGRLDLGVVVQAAYVRETLALLDAPRATTPVTPPSPPPSPQTAPSATPQTRR